jgi:hypothetical protein
MRLRNQGRLKSCCDIPTSRLVSPLKEAVRDDPFPWRLLLDGCLVMDRDARRWGLAIFAIVLLGALLFFYRAHAIQTNHGPPPPHSPA